MYTYKEQTAVPEEGLSTRRLFWLLQEVSAAQSRELGYGEAQMRQRGVMWVVIRYFVEAARWPRAGEALSVQTWPGQTRHGFCPRFYQILDGKGETVLRGCALWAVVDRESRKMVSPQERDVNIEALVTGLEASLPGTIRRPVTDRETAFTVPEEYLDSNGHMNNTTYFDLAERCIGVSAVERGLREVTAEYLNEALCGEEMTVRWGFDGEKYTVVGEAESGHVFRMLLRYGEEKSGANE